MDGRITEIKLVLAAGKAEILKGMHGAADVFLLRSVGPRVRGGR
jgi:hypothetical protein